MDSCDFFLAFQLQKIGLFAILIYGFVNSIPKLAELLVLASHCIAAKLTCKQ